MQHIGVGNVDDIGQSNRNTLCIQIGYIICEVPA